jgi:tetratricopeptide (TPR) repeat protein
MTLLSLFAVPLIFTAMGTADVHQVLNPAPNSATAVVTSPPQKTPLQIEEIRAQTLMAQKDYEGALDVYRKILLQDPKNAKALNQAGIANQELGDFNRAEHFYKMAMHADKMYWNPVNNLGTVEFEKKNYGKAISYFEKAIHIGGKSSSLYLNLGSAYFSSEKYPQAMDSFAKALALDPHAFEPGGEGGSVVEERSAQDLGLFFFMIAKTYAKKGDAERTAHYLKVARDDGYEKFRSAITDPDFARVIDDARVRDILNLPPSYAPEPKKSSSL